MEEKGNKFVPVNGRVFVIPDVKEKKTSGGIFLPDTNSDDPKEKATTGVILAVDKQEEHELNEYLAIGTRILFNKYSSSEVEIVKGKKCVVINKDSVYGIYT